MSFRPALLRSRASNIKTETCVFCQSRQFLASLRRNPFPLSGNGRRVPWAQPQRRPYAQPAPGPRVSREQLVRQRTEIDTRNRATFFALARAEQVLPVDPEVADSIIAEFLASISSKKDSGDTIVELASKYRVEIRDLSTLAILTCRIPDAKEAPVWAPPSEHKNIARVMLLGCSKAGDSLATTHILSALRLRHSVPAALAISSIFSATDIRRCRNDLAALVLKGNPDAMTLEGLFLEQEGKTSQARDMYEKALTLADTKEGLKNHQTKQDSNNLAMPLIPPWNALGCSLIADNSPESQKRAKEVFEVGALEADDPLSHYHLASFYEKTTSQWLKFMNKAAASGHVDAMYQVANFYLQVRNEKSTLKSLISKDSDISTALRWVTSWKRDSPRKLAMEWLDIAARKGHKPSSMTFAKLAEEDGDFEKALTRYYEVAAPPPKGQIEEWSKLVPEARARIQALERR